MSLITSQSTRGNGQSMVSDTGEEFKFGKMVQSMRGFGNEIWQMDAED